MNNYYIFLCQKESKPRYTCIPQQKCKDKCRLMFCRLLCLSKVAQYAPSLAQPLLQGMLMHFLSHQFFDTLRSFHVLFHDNTDAILFKKICDSLHSCGSQHNLPGLCPKLFVWVERKCFPKRIAF